MFSVALSMVLGLVVMISLVEYHIYKIPTSVVLLTQAFLYLFVILWGVISFRSKK
jgi:hypothetical protein